MANAANIRDTNKFTRRLADWLANGPLKKAHDGKAIVWRFGHVQRFAWCALCAGHDGTAIQAAYLAAIGVIAKHGPPQSAGRVTRLAARLLDKKLSP